LYDPIAIVATNCTWPSDSGSIGGGAGSGVGTATMRVGAAGVGRAETADPFDSCPQATAMALEATREKPSRNCRRVTEWGRTIFDMSYPNNHATRIPYHKTVQRNGVGTEEGVRY